MTSFAPQNRIATATSFCTSCTLCWPSVAMRVTLKPALTYPANWLSHVRVTLGSTAMALTVPMPLTVSTRNAWLSAPRWNLSFRRLRSTGVTNAEISAYSGSESATIRVSHLL